MNKILILIFIFLIFNNCSPDKEELLLDKKITNLKKNKSTKTTLTKQVRVEEEFNHTLEIKISEGKFSTITNNNQNDIGELSYQGFLEKVGKYKYSDFNDFEYIETKPIFYKENIIFFDNKGSVIFYDKDQKVVWKKNFYNKSEKKTKPRLNLAIQENILIVTDSIAKYYAIDLTTGEIIWTKNNIFPFSSDIKIVGDAFYAVDYKNTLRSFSIIDGTEKWKLKTEGSLTKSNTKLSIVLDNENIYFNNSIGDITSASIKSGELLWQLPTQNSDIVNNIFQLSSSQLVLNEKSILFSNNKNEFYSIDTKTGLINWKNQINSIVRPIVIGKFIITISSTGYLYLVEKKTGNILRINDLYKNYDKKKRDKIQPTGLIIAMSKVYLTNDDGKLIIGDLNTGNFLNIVKTSNDKISQPQVYNNNLFVIKNGSIIKYN